MSSGFVHKLFLACSAVCAVALGASCAHGAAYRYKDEAGQWVYTDRPPGPGHDTTSIALRGAGASAPRMKVEPRSTASGVALVAVNECRCTVEFAVRVEAGRNQTARKVVGPQSEAIVLEIDDAVEPAAVRYEFGYVVGAPDVQHVPPVPYRAPFALAQRFTVSQAPPDAVTHVDAASRHAIDIDMPVGTAVHAAREGLVISVARNHFRGGLQREIADEANFVQVLHDDGTYALYAHLQLDTVRVRPGQRVARGEYIANSGNTGYSSGPHLHFVVVRNGGLRSESVPVTFAGPGGAAVSVSTGQSLTAY